MDVLKEKTTLDDAMECRWSVIDAQSDGTPAAWCTHERTESLKPEFVAVGCLGFTEICPYFEQMRT